MSLQEKFEELRRKNALALEGGGKKRIETQHAQGKLTARERIELLLGHLFGDARPAPGRWGSRGAVRLPSALVRSRLGRPGGSRVRRGVSSSVPRGPDVYSAHGYDAARIIQRAIARAGSSKPDAVRHILLRMNDFRGAAGRTAFDPRGDVVRYSRMFVVVGSVPVPYDRFVERGGALAVPPRTTVPVPDREVAHWR